MATNNAINKVITSTPTANAVPTWDGNANMSSDNFLPGFTSTASAAGTTVLTVASNKYQLITGSTTQTVRLPDATTCPLGTSFVIINESTGNVTIQDNTPTTLVVLATKSIIRYTLIVNGTAAGTWKIGEDTLITNQQNFTTATTSTYTPTAGTAYIIVEMCGGGGGSGGSATPGSAGNASMSGAGGPGGYLKFMMTAAQIGASLSYTVGAGGGGGSVGSNGTAGGATTFGTWSAGGGGAGQVGAAYATSGVRGGSSAGTNTVGTGTTIFNFRCIAAQSTFFQAGSNWIFIGSQGGSNPLSFSCNLDNPYFLIAPTANSGTVNGYNPLPGFGYGGYSVAGYGNTTIAGVSGFRGAIYVTEYIYV
jgi:hypothetical protein